MPYQIANAMAQDGDSAACKLPSSSFVVIDGGMPLAAEPQTRFVASSHASQASEARSCSPNALNQFFAIMLIVLFVAVAAFCALSVDSFFSETAATAYESAELEQITVHQGDSLWGIAEEHAVAGVSTQDLVHLIQQENDLESATLTPGEQLIVPTAE